jgi:MFS transporter, OFA family, oxalate/formate antiporter
MTDTSVGAGQRRVSEGYRWLQLLIGVIAMVMIANYQYGWTFFVPEITKKFGWKASDIQVAFVLFVLFETWLVPIEGWFVDRYGPRTVIFFGGVLCGLGWWMTSRATSLGGLDGYYAAMIICGVGAGAVYGTCIGNALKWFPDKRGLASGITAAGFGAGSALTVSPIQNMIRDSGFQDTFFYFGIGQGIIICLLAFLINAPKSGQVPATSGTSNVIQTRRQYAPTEIIGPIWAWGAASLVALVLGLAMWWIGGAFYFQLVLAALIFLLGGAIVTARGEPIFVLMYFMFVIVGAGGLMVTANLKPIASTLKIADIPISLMGLTMTAITWAATIDRILNGLTRPFFGWISDNIGRENTMFVAFALEGIGIYLLYLWGHDPLWFVLLSGFVFFAWGEIYSLFPSTCTDTFGARFAATNAGLLYTAKGTAALLTPFTNRIQEATGSWDTVFLIAAGANILAALLALVVLKPWRARVVARSSAGTA